MFLCLEIRGGLCCGLSRVGYIVSFIGACRISSFIWCLVIMASKKGHRKSKGKGPVPKVPRPSAPEVLDAVATDPVNAAILECLVQIESQLGAEGVGRATFAAGADAASFQAQVLACLSFI